MDLKIKKYRLFENNLGWYKDFDSLEDIFIYLRNLKKEFHVTIKNLS